ncbi:hypothetical protein [Flavobacterium sp. FlaQc-47]|uniref:hypothetical protein n=1 Tax=Flavobacterium sp. FlaQc-47 TaxID=3374180 RepID=UPI00375743D3
MKDRKPKCNCAKNGMMCALKLSLIKKGESATSDNAVKKQSVCPSKSLAFNNA